MGTKTGNWLQFRLDRRVLPPTFILDSSGSVEGKAMAKAPEARYACAVEMLHDLELLLRGEPTGLVVHPRLPPFTDAELIA